MLNQKQKHHHHLTLKGITLIPYYESWNYRENDHNDQHENKHKSILEEILINIHYSLNYLWYCNLNLRTLILVHTKFWYCKVTHLKSTDHHSYTASGFMRTQSRTTKSRRLLTSKSQRLTRSSPYRRDKDEQIYFYSTTKRSRSSSKTAKTTDINETQILH